MATVCLQSNHLCAGWNGSLGRTYDDALGPIIVKKPRIYGQPPERINDDARRISATRPAHGEQRIVRNNGPDTDNNGVDAGAQPVQVVQRGAAVDPAAFAGQGRYTSVERLAQLGNDIGLRSRRGRNQITELHWRQSGRDQRWDSTAFAFTLILVRLQFQRRNPKDALSTDPFSQHGPVPCRDRMALKLAMP